MTAGGMKHIADSVHDISLARALWPFHARMAMLACETDGWTPDLPRPTLLMQVKAYIHGCAWRKQDPGFRQTEHGDTSNTLGVTDHFTNCCSAWWFVRASNEKDKGHQIVSPSCISRARWGLV